MHPTHTHTHTHTPYTAGSHSVASAGAQGASSAMASVCFSLPQFQTCSTRAPSGEAVTAKPRTDHHLSPLLSGSLSCSCLQPVFCCWDSCCLDIPTITLLFISSTPAVNTQQANNGQQDGVLCYGIANGHVRANPPPRGVLGPLQARLPAAKI